MTLPLAFLVAEQTRLLVRLPAEQRCPRVTFLAQND